MKLFARDPFTLMAFHRVLISVAMLGAIGFGWWQLRRGDGGNGSPLGAAISWGIAVGLLVYFWNIRRKR